MNENFRKHVAWKQPEAVGRGLLPKATCLRKLSLIVEFHCRGIFGTKFFCQCDRSRGHSMVSKATLQSCLDGKDIAGHRISTDQNMTFLKNQVTRPLSVVFVMAT